MFYSIVKPSPQTLLGHFKHLKRNPILISGHSLFSSRPLAPIFVFSDHNRIKLETDNLDISETSPTIWKLNDKLINNSQIKGEIKRKIKMYENTNRIKQSLWNVLNSAYWEINSTLNTYVD